MHLISRTNAAGCMTRRCLERSRNIMIETAKGCISPHFREGSILTDSTVSARRFRSLGTLCVTARCSAVAPALLRALALAPAANSASTSLRLVASTACDNKLGCVCQRPTP